MNRHDDSSSKPKIRLLKATFMVNALCINYFFKSNINNICQMSQ
jgi:hypothetical protein